MPYQSVDDVLQRLRQDPHDQEASDALAEALGEDHSEMAALLEPLSPSPSPAAEPARGGSPGAAPKPDLGTEWTNHAGNQRVEPLQRFTPQTLAELVGIVQKARDLGAKVKAVAAGYSVSDVATTTGFLVETTQMCETVPVGCLRLGVDKRYLYRFEAGLTVDALNQRLASGGLALPNMPSSVKLTFVGGMMTASHGSGVTTGTLASVVRSMVLVASDGTVYRIEPALGNGAITHRPNHEAVHPEVVLVQDNDWFYSAVVSMGTMGLVYSVTIECEDMFWLSETRKVSTWGNVKAALLERPPGVDPDSRGFEALPPLLTGARHVEILLNPYKTGGTYTTVVTTRHEVGAVDDPPEPKGARNWLTQMLASIPFSDTLIVELLNVVPTFSPKAIDMALDGLENEDVVRKGYELLDLGSPATLDAYAIELAFPWYRVVEVCEAIIALAESAAETGERYQNSPISLRFVAAEKAYMAPQYSTDAMVSCMLELPVLVGSEAGYDLLERIQRAMYALGGRPHWGLELDLLTDANGTVSAMYPKFDVFKRVHAKLNSEGLFTNRTTARLGLNPTTFDR